MFHRIIFILIPSALLLGCVMTADDRLPSAETPLTCGDMENFLRNAAIGTQTNIPIGVTRPKRATLDDGKLRHDAAIQTTHSWFQAQSGAERFKDWWEFNVASYELAKMLELNMVPPYVERKLADQSAALSWWINDTVMELERVQKGLQPPDRDTWDREVHVIRVFNQLIGNMGTEHLTNFLIDKNWHLWMIDFTRAFPTTKSILNKKNLARCERKLLANMRKLDKETVQARLGRYLTGREIDGLLARRDKIVRFLETEAANQSEAAVLFDLPRVGEPCGLGL